MKDLIAIQILLPFVGTSLGAACVFFIKGKMDRRVQRFLMGFAAGVMVAASVWSLLIPSIEAGSPMGKWAFVPAVAGIFAGILFLMLLDKLIPHLHMNADEAEGPKSSLRKSTMLSLAVALHNLPEGIAVGVMLPALLTGNDLVSPAAAFALSLGIAIQNFPEGAIISMPLASEGVSRKKSFILGVLSGAVEPVAALLTFLVAGAMASVLPYLLSFAAGAMLYVVVEELIPEMSEGEHSHAGTLAFAVGFALMIVIDVVLG